jgi:CHAT domain-containing protein
MTPDRANNPHPPALQFWDILERALGEGVRRIYLSPDGVLENFSFPIIPTKSGKLVFDLYDLQVVSSTRDLVAMRPLATRNKSALLVGYPNFDMGRVPQNGRDKDRNASVARLKKWEELPATRKEVTDVSGILQNHGWSTEILGDDSATVEFVRTEIQRHPSVLHFATHAFFSAERGDSGPALVMARMDTAMRSTGMVLAGANTALDNRDEVTRKQSILTSADISAMDLTGTQIVVLSACDTGLSDVLGNGEVFGLRRAFQIAGAHTVLMSMWSVPSAETSELIALFYRGWLDGIEEHEALRNAQSRIRSRMPAPFFWGAFVLVEK